MQYIPGATPENTGFKRYENFSRNRCINHRSISLIDLEKSTIDNELLHIIDYTRGIVLNM